MIIIIFFLELFGGVASLCSLPTTIRHIYYYFCTLEQSEHHMGFQEYCLWHCKEKYGRALACFVMRTHSNLWPHICTVSVGVYSVCRSMSCAYVSACIQQLTVQFSDAVFFAL